MFSVTNSDGNRFNVRIVYPGDTYGYGRMLTYRVDDHIEGNPTAYHGPMVEFYDADYEGKEDFQPEGQFVTRYFVDAILNHKPYAGLILQGNVPKWHLDGVNVTDVKTYLISKLTAPAITILLEQLDPNELTKQIEQLQHLTVFMPGTPEEINRLRGTLNLLLHIQASTFTHITPVTVPASTGLPKSAINKIPKLRRTCATCGSSQHSTNFHLYDAAMTSRLSSRL